MSLDLPGSPRESEKFLSARYCGVRNMLLPGRPQPPTCRVQGVWPYTGCGRVTVMAGGVVGAAVVLKGRGQREVQWAGTSTVTLLK